jgi:RHS repeat-associated protein
VTLLATSAPTQVNNLRFPGQYADSETGLFYNYFRTYDPKGGRYTQNDPIGLDGGWNRFAYVEANPLSLIDPLGLRSQPCNCPTPPQAPPGASCDDNIREAKKHANPKWFYDQVRNKGPWDYKQSGSQYQNFGNFNFGATAGAYGFNLAQAQMGAGWAQSRAGTSSPAWGDWKSGPPYGDDPADQAEIERGYQYYRCNCWMRKTQ